MSSLVESKERATAEYEKSFGRFVLRNTNYSLQYNTLYISRLAEIIVNLRKEASAKWPEIPILDKIIDSEIRAIGNEEVVLVGTIIKNLKLRGSVLNEFQMNMGISGAVQSLENISSSRDSLIIEDESGRAALAGAILPHVQYIVGGIAIAVKGTVINGEFVVSEWTFAHQTSTISEGPASALTASHSKSDKYLAFVSGIQVGSDDSGDSLSELSQQMLADYLSGRLGSEDDVQLASQIVKVIVAGNSIKPVDVNTTKERYSGAKTLVTTATPTKQFDILMSQIVSSCPVDVMPGATDISTLAIPQQPLHPCLFPHCSRFNSFSRVPNPYEAKFDQLLVAGTSGQPITDIARQTKQEADAVVVVDTKEKYVPIVYTDDDNDTEAMVVEESEVAKQEDDKNSLNLSNSCLDILRNTLTWGHLCPTMPDTLAGYTFQNNDPMIIQQVPSVLFAGNQPKFLTSLVDVTHHHNANGTPSTKKCRLVCIPEFKTSPILVLVNLSRDDLECSTISFNQDQQ